MQSYDISLPQRVRLAAGDLVKTLADSFGGIENAAGIVASMMLQQGEDESDADMAIKIAAVLSIEPQQVAILMSSPSFSDALDKAAAYQVYAPTDRIKAMKNFTNVVVEGKKTVASGGQVVEVDRDVSELVAAEKYLRGLQGRETLVQAAPTFNIIFEGLSDKDARAIAAQELEDVIDADFKPRIEKEDLTTLNPKEQASTDERRRRAREAIQSRLGNSDSGRLPPESALSRYAADEVRAPAQAADFFDEAEDDRKAEASQSHADVQAQEATLSAKALISDEGAANYQSVVQKDREAIAKGGKQAILNSKDREKLTHAEWLARQVERAEKKKALLKKGLDNE